MSRTSANSRRYAAISRGLSLGPSSSYGSRVATSTSHSARSASNAGSGGSGL
jgi:hypothetical protein